MRFALQSRTMSSVLEDTVWGPPPEYKSRTIPTQVSYEISKIVAE
jgi:hypothetical protein